MIHNPPKITVTEARAIDAAAVSELGISSLLLMENAARSVCQTINRHFDDMASICIACGSGNNGGDGLALARLLAAEGLIATTYLINADRQLSDDAEVNRLLLQKSGVPIITDPQGERFQQDIGKLTAESLIVDCLLGTGLQGNLKSPYANTVKAINDSTAKILAVDVPSGLNAETGQPGNPTVIADRTVTFVGIKPGFETATSQPSTGPIVVAPIGLPLQWTNNFLKQLRH